MDYMYAPWREVYFTEKVDGCVFCNITKHAELDEKHHVLYRDQYCFIVMNRYPYSPGHIMVIPYFHTCIFFVLFSCNECTNEYIRYCQGQFDGISFYSCERKYFVRFFKYDGFVL